MKEETVKKIFESFKRSAKDIAEAYASQHRFGMDDFIIYAVDGARPPASLMYAAAIIKDLAKKAILGIVPTDEEIQDYLSDINEHGEKETPSLLLYQELLRLSRRHTMWL
jgi:hypothetical protein